MANPINECCVSTMMPFGISCQMYFVLVGSRQEYVWMQAGTKEGRGDWYKRDFIKIGT